MQVGIRRKKEETERERIGAQERQARETEPTKLATSPIYSFNVQVKVD